MKKKNDVCFFCLVLIDQSGYCYYCSVVRSYCVLRDGKVFFVFVFIRAYIYSGAGAG